MSSLLRLRELRAGLRWFVHSSSLEQEIFVRELLAKEEKYQDGRNLNRFEQRVFSQSGEDGILREVFHRIGAESKTFVEIGSGDGLENNTACLLFGGWGGIWIEGNRRQVRRARSKYQKLLASGILRVEKTVVTAESVEETLVRAEAPKEPDLLSIDIDGNEYWLWKAIVSLSPRVVVVEYNALFPPDMKWIMAYGAPRRWDGTTHHGASLASLAALGREKGYCLVGCSLSGVNAFFVREDLIGDHFQEPFTADRHWEPLRIALTVCPGPPRSVGDFVLP